MAHVPEKEREPPGRDAPNLRERAEQSLPWQAPDVDEAGAGEVDDGWEAVADGEGDCALAVADGEGDACDGAWAAEGEGDAWEEGVVEGAEAEGAEEGLAWDGDEAEAAALDVAYECLNAENQEAPSARGSARDVEGGPVRGGRRAVPGVRERRMERWKRPGAGWEAL